MYDKRVQIEGEVGEKDFVVLGCWLELMWLLTRALCMYQKIAVDVYADDQGFGLPRARGGRRGDRRRHRLGSLSWQAAR